MIETRPTGETLADRASEAFAAFQQGDRSAFNSLVQLTTPLLWHAARSQGVSRVGAEDVLQSVWLSLLHNADSVREPRSILKWLLTSVRREAWRVAQRERALVEVRSSVEGDGGAELPAPESEHPDTVLIRNRREQRLWEHVQQLPPKCRALLRVIAFADRPDYATIAESLGMPVGSIGPTRGRCLAKLRDRLDNDQGWEA